MSKIEVDEIVNQTGDNDSGIDLSTNDVVAVKTANTERMRLQSDGDLLYNTTSTTVGGATSATSAIRFDRDGAILQVASNANLCAILNRSESTGEIVSIRTAGVAKGGITVNSGSVSFNTSSDYRLKENVVTDWDATTRLKQLKPSRFNFIADADTTVDGFLAHEVSSIVPEAITGTKDAVDADGNPEYQGIDQSKLVPLLVKTIQELEARITALESK